MATGATENAIWPMPKFKFDVKWASGLYKMSFSEVSGLDAEAQIIEYRHGNSKNPWPIKMPGVQKYSNVSLKRGVFVGQNQFYAWFAKIQLNTIKRETITISLLNEKNKPTMVWTLHNAWPTKVTGTDLKSDANEAAIETMEIAFEWMTIKNNNNP